eukprot:4569500-Amphidinium_carterae.1
MGSSTKKRRATKVSHSKRRRFAEELTDAGGVTLTGTSESGQKVRMRMRLTEMRKPLASAHRSLRANAAYMKKAAPRRCATRPLRGVASRGLTSQRRCRADVWTSAMQH